MFFNDLISVLTPKHSIVFRILLRAGLFPPLWSCADVPIPKGTMFFFGIISDLYN